MFSCTRGSGVVRARPLATQENRDEWQIRTKNKAPDEKPTVTLTGKVEKIVPRVHSGEPEKAQIEVEVADHLRVENTLTDGSGQKVKMKEGAHVEVTIEADPAETTPKKPADR